MFSLYLQNFPSKTTITTCFRCNTIGILIDLAAALSTSVYLQTIKQTHKNAKSNSLFLGFFFNLYGAPFTTAVSMLYNSNLETDYK